MFISWGFGVMVGWGFGYLLIQPLPNHPITHGLHQRPHPHPLLLRGDDTHSGVLPSWSVHRNSGRLHACSADVYVPELYWQVLLPVGAGFNHLRSVSSMRFLQHIWPNNSTYEPAN